MREGSISSAGKVPQVAFCCACSIDRLAIGELQRCRSERDERERERDREEHVANRSERDGYARGDTLRRGHFGHGLRFHVHLCGSSVHSSIGVACCGGKPCDHPTVAHAPLSLEIPGLDIDLWGIDATHLFTVTCAESGEQSLLLPQASLSG
jgi:hypothetical protein